jgi:hypothetical protein
MANSLSTGVAGSLKSAQDQYIAQRPIKSVFQAKGNQKA